MNRLYWSALVALHLITSLNIVRGENDDFDFEPILEGLPSGFVFGTATAAYQIEGAVNEDGRGPTIWDKFSHMDPPKIANNESGDVACDSYHKFAEDADLAKAAGFAGFRLSLAWSRIYPDGEGDVPNPAGIRHYHEVIDALLERDLEPMVTLYHWDLPQALEDKYGGWLSPKIVDAFEAYADTCFREFGGKVKKWLTINEPWSFIHHGYSAGNHAPGRCSDRDTCAEGNSLTEPYQAGHNALNAHARAVSLYRRKYKLEQGGAIGITLNCDWGEPLDLMSQEDQDAASRYMEFVLGWWADPIYFGDYPPSMRNRVGDRLPTFTDDERALLLGSNDFFGLNHYTSWYITDIPDEDPPRAGTTPAKAKQQGVDLPETSPNDGWAQDLGVIQTKHDLAGNLNGFASETEWLTAVPKGFRNLLKWVDQRYGHPALHITENGLDRKGESGMTIDEAVHDHDRKTFFQEYLKSMSLAVSEDEIDIRSYYAWSLLDNFEWSDGYTPRFGITYVDYEDDQKRTRKDSSRWFQDLARARDIHARGESPRPKWYDVEDDDVGNAADGSAKRDKRFTLGLDVILLLAGMALVLVGYGVARAIEGGRSSLGLDDGDGYEQVK